MGWGVQVAAVAAAAAAEATATTATAETKAAVAAVATHRARIRAYSSLKKSGDTSKFYLNKHTSTPTDERNTTIHLFTQGSVCGRERVHACLQVRVFARACIG